MKRTRNGEGGGMRGIETEWGGEMERLEGGGEERKVW